MAGVPHPVNLEINVCSIYRLDYYYFFFTERLSY